MRPLYIFDLDGTLADISHRLHFLAEKPKKWDAFFAACGDDKPIKSTLKLAHSLYEETDADVWVWSGRDDDTFAVTYRWLYTHLASDYGSGYLKMRPHGDHRDDAVLKKEWLDAMKPEDRSRLVAVFEDRKRVVDMWRENGVTCYQVAPGDF